MQYRVMRGMGNTDLPPGSVFDSEAKDANGNPVWSEARIARLRDQRYIEPVVSEGGAEDAVADLVAEVESLKAELRSVMAVNDRLAGDIDDMRAKMGDIERRGAATPAAEGEPMQEPKRGVEEAPDKSGATNDSPPAPVVDETDDESGKEPDEGAKDAPNLTEGDPQQVDPSVRVDESAPPSGGRRSRR